MMESGNRIFLDGDASELVFSFAFNDDENTLIKHEARVQFQRTLRVPDDGLEYPLPAGLGSFPLVHSRSQKLDLPAHMKSRGGVVFPIYPFEAAWMNFYCESMFPIALRIAAGKINAVTGDDWSESTPEIQDYVVLPEQYWLDGFNTGDGQVRQFVAAKLGANLTVEEQVSGRSEWGGIQILAIPMKSERYIELLQNNHGALDGAVMCMSEAPECMSLEMDMSMDMGMGQGGTIRQTIEDDPYGIDAWDFEKAQRVFVSMIDARAWPKVGGEAIPTPVTSEQYEKEGIPWFNLEGFSDVPKSEKLSKLKSVQAGMVELGVEVDTISPKVTPPRQIGRGVADGFG
jgi:hypothetical protein